MALYVAAYADDFLKSLVKGEPDYYAMKSLMHALRELENKIIGGASFHERAEDLHSMP